MYRILSAWNNFTFILIFSVENWKLKIENWKLKIKNFTFILIFFRWKLKILLYIRIYTFYKNIFRNKKLNIFFYILVFIPFLKIRLCCSVAGAGFVVVGFVVVGFAVIGFAVIGFAVVGFVVVGFVAVAGFVVLFVRSGFNRFLLQHARKSPATGAGFILVYFTWQYN